MDLSCIMRAVQAWSHTARLYIDQICLYFSFVKPETHQVSIWHYAAGAGNNAHSPSLVDNIQSSDVKKKPNKTAVWEIEPLKLRSAIIIRLFPLSCEVHNAKSMLISPNALHI